MFSQHVTKTKTTKGHLYVNKRRKRNLTWKKTVTFGIGLKTTMMKLEAVESLNRLVKNKKRCGHVFNR